MSNVTEQGHPGTLALSMTPEKPERLYGLPWSAAVPEFPAGPAPLTLPGRPAAPEDRAEPLVSSNRPGSETKSA